jgi:conjugative relaxase-like TrwC/TraI family protein
MSLGRLVSASQAGEYYYEKDPVFASGGKGENSQWEGKLAEHFGLDGRIRKEDFEQAVAGNDPRSGKALIRAAVNAGVESERRAGIDLAFSAPKSVSIAALHLGDDRIVAAHDAAVSKALSYVQEHLIYYRVTVAGDTYMEQSDNMLVSRFKHGTSRANDPQLHTHAVVLNMTECKDGKIRAISNEHIFQNQKLVNAIYQNELSIELQKLGYSIDNYGNKFELRGISEEVLDTFSKRSREINEKYEKLKEQYPSLTEAELRDKAVLMSRKEKNYDITYDELKESWQREAARENINPAMEGKGAIWERDLFDTAIEEIEKTEATYSRRSVLYEMLTLSKGEYELDELEGMIDKKISEGAIREVGTHIYYNKEEIHYATIGSMQTENRIVEILNSTSESREAILDEKNFKDMLSREYEAANNKKELTVGQRAFVKGALTGEDFIGFVQGDAGTGKTAAVERIREILEVKESNVEVIGLGFTGIAADELGEAAKIDTSTIASFLLSPKSGKMNNKLFIVDEASMVDSKDMLSILETALAGENNRVMFVGDAKQFQAVGMGKMFKELQRSGMTKAQAQVIIMTEVLRQKTGEMKELVKTIKDYQENKNPDGIKDAFELMTRANYISEIRADSLDEEVTRSKIQEKAIEEYLSSDNALLFTASRKERDELNVKVREKKFTDVELQESKRITVRENIGESRLAAHYRKNDIVASYNRNTKKYMEYRVREVLSNQNKIVLTYTDKGGVKERTVDLSREKVDRCFREMERAITVGEQILFTRNDKMIGKGDGLKNGIKNGTKGIVEKLDSEGNIGVKLRNGKHIKFNLNKYNNLEYAYAVTTHKTQGATCKKAIMIHTADDNVKTESFYTAATRATHNLKVYTPDIEKLKRCVSREQEKTSTLEFGDRVRDILRDEARKQPVQKLSTQKPPQSKSLGSP